MQEHVEIAYLLARGEISPAICSDQRFMKILPIVNAVQHFYSAGEQPPFDITRIGKLAKRKFHANEEIEEILTAAELMKPDKTLLQAVQQGLLLDKMVEVVTRQKANGEWNPLAIEQLLKYTSPTDDYMHDLSIPNQQMIDIIMRTTFPDVDKVIGGFGAELIIFSARPKNGKTTALLNLAARQPKDLRVLYVTVADYGAQEINYLLNMYNPQLLKTKTKGAFKICDYNMLRATVLDVERAIKQHEPTLCIVDRAEKLKPLKAHSDRKRDDVGEIFDTLRNYAKRYNCAVVVDSQYSSAGAEHMRGKHPWMSSEFMAEDRTNRQGTFDLWVGVMRNAEEGSVTWFMEGRRPGALPDVFRLKTDATGRYL